MDPALQGHGFGDIEEPRDLRDAPVDSGEDDVAVLRNVNPSTVTSGHLTSSPPSSDENGIFGQPVRPGLRRETSVPAPRQVPLTAAGQTAPRADAEDSLSILQLKTLVRDLPQTDTATYAYRYADTATLPEELEEWFTYGTEDREMILRTRFTFAEEWGRFGNEAGSSISTYLSGNSNWRDQPLDRRRGFIQDILANLDTVASSERARHLEALAYIVLGCWYETAGVLDDGEADNSESDEEEDKNLVNSWISSHKYSATHLTAIEDNARLLLECGALQPVFLSFQHACDIECSSSLESATDEIVEPGTTSDKIEFWCTTTILYFLIQASISNDVSVRLDYRRQLLELNPGVPEYLAGVMDKIRWDDNLDAPPMKLLSMYWKAILVVLGGTAELKDVKSSFSDPNVEQSDTKGFPIITASPLDYALFRQEISSKYPAYNPPPPLFPSEPDNISILQPLKTVPPKSTEAAPGLGSLQGHSNSLLQQPVHIATPAPSPPPSPAVSGKSGKKQNYQTNQMFPFLYPPLDETSNQLGGMGSTELQDALVGRKWQGSDIPASILEAAELFSKRMRATRAMKQLWEQRIEFMKHERGWKASADDSDVESVVAISDHHSDERDASSETNKYDGSVEDRLAVVEQFYRNVLPHLQSVVMVLVKVVLSHVTALVTQMNSQGGLQNGFQYQDNHNGDTSARADLSNGINGTHSNTTPPSIDDLNASRSQEIAGKAVTGILILLLKWFKASHILKYEYLTQLLVDASYIPIVLKLMQSQEIERLVNFRWDSEELGFFHLCRANSFAGIPEPPSWKMEDEASYIHQSSSEDEAAPPPIKRHRETPASEPPPAPVGAPPAPPVAKALSDEPASVQIEPTSAVPEVDELGIPTTVHPALPITTFSQRNFFAAITSLRILRAVCARHAHRNLMLVQYKSTPVLRRILRVPQPELRQYALKLVKAQVPFCGRKWRQSNMRVITAVWLSIRPELRDDWLSGSDVESIVEEAVPREQAIRSLVHWWHLRRYWDVVGPRGTAGLGSDLSSHGEVEEEVDISLKEDTEAGPSTEASDGSENTTSRQKKRSKRSRSWQERQQWLEEESDFFRKELERMDWDWPSDTDSMDGQGDAGSRGLNNGQVWDGLPMDSTGW